jgi:hypothetical protein
MEKDYLLLKRAAASRPSGQWSDDDYDVLADGVVVGRIFKAKASSPGTKKFFCKSVFHTKATVYGTEPFLDRFLGEGA